MKKTLVISLIIVFILTLIISIFILKSKTNNPHRNDVYQVDDFIATIDADDVLKTNKIKATITYVGKNNERAIYNGGRIFSFSVQEKNGTFKYPFMVTMAYPMPLSLEKTVLFRNKPKIEEYEFPKQIIQKLKPGKTYEFKVDVSFSLDKNVTEDNNLNLNVSSVLTR